MECALSQCSAILEEGSFSVNLGGRTLVLARSADLESLWEAMGAEDFEDERIPYWTELWPGSLVLAEWLSRRDLSGKLTLDLGCGLGLTAIVSAERGAPVIAADYEFAALKHCVCNARLNSAPAPWLVQADWRRPPFHYKSFDIIQGGDIIYERRAIEPVAKLLEHSLKPDGVAWIADPGRGPCDEFIETLRGDGYYCEVMFRRRVASPHSSEPLIGVAVWEIRKPSPGAK